MHGKVIVAALTVSMAVMVVGTSVQADSSTHGAPRWSLEKKFFHKAHAILDHGEALGLSEEQLDAIRTLKRETKKALVRQDAEIQLVSIDLKAQLKNDTVDTEAAGALVDQKYALKTAKARMVLEAYAKLKAALNAKQHKQLRELWKGASGKAHGSRKGS